MAKKASGRVPKKTRRLTRDEAARLGVSYGAKRRVNASVKNVTKTTRLYTDRQVAEASIKRRALEAATTLGAKRKARKLNREKYEKSRVETRKLKSGGTVTEYKNLTKAQLMKRLRASGQKAVMLKFTGGDKGAMYKSRRLQAGEWRSSSATIDADELLDPGQFADFLETNGVSEIPRFSVIVYD